MTVVLDAGVVLAALVDDENDGPWAVRQLRSGGLSAPHLMPGEVSNALRRGVMAGFVDPRLATDAHDDLAGLRVDLFPYRGVASRVWALRENLTAYDAWYVALAESLDAPLVTLDRRLARAPGPTCEFLTP